MENTDNLFVGIKATAPEVTVGESACSTFTDRYIRAGGNGSVACLRSRPLGSLSLSGSVLSSSHAGQGQMRSVATQTLDTQAMPPMMPAARARRVLSRSRDQDQRVKLNTRQCMLPAFRETPQKTMHSLREEMLGRFNCRGKGCCTFHIGLHALQQRILEMKNMNRNCRQKYNPVEDQRWQCASCSALNEANDTDSEDDEICGLAECALCGFSQLPRNGVSSRSEDLEDYGPKWVHQDLRSQKFGERFLFMSMCVDAFFHGFGSSCSAPGGQKRRNEFN